MGQGTTKLMKLETQTSKLPPPWRLNGLGKKKWGNINVLSRTLLGKLVHPLDYIVSYHYIFHAIFMGFTQKI